MGSAKASEERTPEERAQREAFVKAAISELKKRPDLRTHLSSEEKETITTSPLLQREALEVMKAFCYDFPTVDSEDCATLAGAIRDGDWRLKHRLSYRCPRGVKQMTSKRGGGGGEGAADLAAAIGVSAVKALLEMSRSHVVRFASKPFFGNDDLADMLAQRRNRDAAAVSETTTTTTTKKASSTLDYSKWDTLNSDSDDCTSPEPVVVSAPPQAGYDVSTSTAVANAKEGIEFLLECAAVAEANAMLPLKDEAKWSALLEDVRSVALALRGDDSAEGGWLLSKDDDSRLRQQYERYVFLARDFCLSCPLAGPRREAAKLLVDLALEHGGSGARSAKDGGVALVAVATLSTAAAAATTEIVLAKEEELPLVEPEAYQKEKPPTAEAEAEGAAPPKKKKEEEASSSPAPAPGEKKKKKKKPLPMLSSGEALGVFREAARRVLPAVAELVRAVAHDRGDGDESLVGAALAIVETANGVSTSADSTATATTGAPESAKREPPVAHFTTHFEVHGGGAAPGLMIDTGLLAGLCALAPRLRAESVAASSAASSRSSRAQEAEVRLHRLLASCAAQNPDRLGAYLARCTPLLDVIYDVTFVDRRPAEAAIWAARLGAVHAQLPDTPQRVVVVVEDTQRVDDLLRRALPIEALLGQQGQGQGHDDHEVLLPRLRVAAHVLTHLNATRRGAALWLEKSTYANDYFIRLRDVVFSAGTTQRSPKAPPDQGSAPQKDDDDHVPEEDAPDAKIKLRAAAREKIFAHLRRELKLLPIAERPAADTTPASPHNVRGKLD